MTDAASVLPAPASLPDLAERLRTEIAALDRELAEIQMLIAQASNEAGRHETRRTQAAEKVSTAASSGGADLAELNTQLVTMTRRAAVMEAQVDVLNGKLRALTRYRDAVDAHATAIEAMVAGGVTASPPADAGGEAGRSGEAVVSSSRVVLGAQEDLRREIARAMHDGPAQSLANIVLQAQIVERLVAPDDEGARRELRLLVEMVQQTLEATKSFIFEVRPMVLDDLGLVPTLRRAARERARRGEIPVTFDSDGQDRRLSMDLESGVFRIVDDAVAAFLERDPDRVTIDAVWDVDVVVDVRASRDPLPEPAPGQVPDAPGADVPPALAAMIEDRRAAALTGPEPPALPPAVWAELAGRAAALGIELERLEEGTHIRLRVPGPEASA